MTKKQQKAVSEKQVVRGQPRHTVAAGQGGQRRLRGGAAVKRERERTKGQRSSTLVGLLAAKGSWLEFTQLRLVGVVDGVFVGWPRGEGGSR